MRYGCTAKPLAKGKLKYSRISECNVGASRSYAELEQPMGCKVARLISGRSHSAPPQAETFTPACSCDGIVPMQAEGVPFVAVGGTPHMSSA